MGNRRRRIAASVCPSCPRPGATSHRGRPGHAGPVPRPPRGKPEPQYPGRRQQGRAGGWRGAGGGSHRGAWGDQPGVSAASRRPIRVPRLGGARRAGSVPCPVVAYTLKRRCRPPIRCPAGELALAVQAGHVGQARGAGAAAGWPVSWLGPLHPFSVPIREKFLDALNRGPPPDAGPGHRTGQACPPRPACGPARCSGDGMRAFGGWGAPFAPPSGPSRRRPGPAHTRRRWRAGGPGMEFRQG